ncbi:MAG: hypothetical protein PUK62_06000 [Prevotellaceae bacterium]|nr:hypothetical protein [Prevotellaceae bacterium]
MEESRNFLLQTMTKAEVADKAGTEKKTQLQDFKQYFSSIKI